MRATSSASPNAINALDALYVGNAQGVNWMLDADIRGFFAIDHEWLKVRASDSVCCDTSRSG